MKHIFLGIALAAAAFGSARAETVYVGNSIIDAVSGSAQCTSTFVVGDTARLLWRPRGTPLGNGADSEMTYLSTRSAFHMHLANNSFKANVNYSGHSIGSTGAIGSNTGGIVSWEQDPASVSGVPATVKITAKIANFFRFNPCVVTLRVNMLKR